MSEQERIDIEAFISSLPDPQAARTFLDRLDDLKTGRAAAYRGNTLLLARLLTLAAYSPFLADTLLRHPEHIEWLERETERDLDTVKSTEQLSEDLARFAARIIEADPQTRLARFKRREMLRIYLRDCLAVATLSEVTEELSNLADVILQSALSLAQQEAINLHGSPLARDERGRVAPAEFAIVALGKLGCRELNYASDIDLLFLYSGVGETAGDSHNRKPAISNKEFFTRVAERIAQMIGGSSSEGAIYRLDLRLRPYGRDGDMVWEVERAANYYRDKAQSWERQALIRARACAGSESVMARFLDLVRDAVFQPETLPDALADVQRAKEKIDRSEAARTGGFNVKLGRGGIREIEFIAQALQLAHGGREPWVRSAQTLIVLARLAEKGYLSESERAKLSSGYAFLRMVEHRLQMEHGAQTHRLPLAPDRLALLARRCGYSDSPDPAASFVACLQAHTSAVRAIFNRVFLESRDERQPDRIAPAAEQRSDDEAERLIEQAANAIEKLIAGSRSATAEESYSRGADLLEQTIASAAPYAINPLRSLRNLIAWAGSLATYDGDAARKMRVGSFDFLTIIERLTLVLSSQYLSHILVSRPILAASLIEDGPARTARDFHRVLRDAVDSAEGAASKTDALRRAWYRLVIGIGWRDVMSNRKPRAEQANDAAAPQARAEISNPKATQPGSDEESISSSNDESISSSNDESIFAFIPDAGLRANNLEQTALAEASLSLGLEIALDALGFAGEQVSRLRFSILGLGRLGHTGMDYGSDLDLLIVYDDRAPWPPPLLDSAAESDAAQIFGSPQEFYAKLTSQLVRVLSSVTREGFLYRLDLRLRPDGRSGALAQGLGSLLAYLSERASAWEHSAYLKAREVAGDLSFGARARQAICEASLDAAARNASLKEELALMRARLEKEKARHNRQNIKWGPGGMTDVYFITRYLQLRDRLYFPPERGTSALILHLGERGLLDPEATRALSEGYYFLRRLDHWMRLLLDLPGSFLPATQIARRDIAHSLGLASVEEFEREYARHTAAIRSAYARIFA